MEKRKVNFDLLRVISAFFVIILHVSSGGVSNPQNPEFFYYNIYSQLSRFAVPIFIMISGYFNLNRKMTIKKAIDKSLRLYIIIVFWAIVYLLKNLLAGGSMPLIQISQELVLGHYHMWFLYMTIGLYLATPILDAAFEKIENLEYFLILGLIFSIITPSLFIIFKNGSLTNLIASYFSYFYFGLSYGFTIYYSLGSYLGRREIKHKNAIYIVGLIAILVSIYGQYKMNVNRKGLIYGFYDVMGIFAYLYSTAIFLFIKNLKIERDFVKRIIEKLADLSLGIFLIHDLFLGRSIRLFAGTHPLIRIFLASSLIFLLSALAAWILKKIPWVKNHLL